MRTITESVVTTTKVKVYEPGDLFKRPGYSAIYQLVTLHVGDQPYAILVNRKTGESVHKAKLIANYEYVTVDEFVEANFNNPPAAEYQD